MRNAAHDCANPPNRLLPPLLARLFPARILAACGLALLLIPPSLYAQSQAKPDHLVIYTIDVEGGQSTLLVAPSGASLLVDTGWPENNARDTDRILAAI